MERTLTIREAKNGWVATLSYCDKKGGLSGYHSEDFILSELPDGIKEMMEGKISGKQVTTPEKRMKTSFDDALAEIEAKDKKDED